MARTKVMINAQGIPRIQEEDGDIIKVYSLEAWQAEQAKRKGEELVEVISLPDQEVITDAPKDEDEDEDVQTPQIASDDEPVNVPTIETEDEEDEPASNPLIQEDDEDDDTLNDDEE